MNTPISHVSKQNGISLVEVMVALAVGLLVLNGVIQILTNSTETYRVQNAIMRMQENGQFAMEYLSKDIRNTDFWGCLTSVDDLTNQLNPAGGSYDATFHDFSMGLNGTEDETGGGDALAGTDTLTVRGANTIGAGASLQSPFGPTAAADLNVAAGVIIQAGEILLVSDCLSGDIFQATSVAGTAIQHAAAGSPGNLSDSLSKVYNGEAFLYRPYTRIYDIRTGTSGQPSLFMTDDSGSQELVEGVENMIVRFGEDTTGDGTANRYVQADGVTDMNNVVSVRIALLVQSMEDNLTPTSQAYTFNGTQVTPADNRLRRVYTSTIVLRNRVS